MLGLVDGDRLYSPGPPYHNQAFPFGQVVLFVGGSAVLNNKFAADRALSGIERYRPTVLNGVPTMMPRMLRASIFNSIDLVCDARTVAGVSALTAHHVRHRYLEKLLLANR